MIAAVCVVAGAASGGGTATPQRGGTLQILGSNDIVNLDPLSAYYAPNWVLERGFARQLFSYRAVASFPGQTTVAPDVATALPTVANGGLSTDRTTYTIHIKQGVLWGTSPPRQVTAADFEREFKVMCNPAMPVGAPGYFETTIVGMKAYCTGFARAKPTADAIQAYVNSHELSGVSTSGPLTIVFHLLAPAPDFLNILAMGFASARPVEYMQYVPDSAEFRQHTISDGPYKIAKYEASTEIDLVRNPAWDPKTDPLRHAYVDAIKVTQGLSGDNVQLQLEVGTGDLEWDVPPPSQRIPALIASHDPRLAIGPPGPYYSLLSFFAVNQYAGPFRSKLVRQAAQYAIDRRAVVRFLGGQAVASPASQAILPGNVGYVRGWAPYSTEAAGGNPAKAKALLAKAGYPNGVSIKLLYANLQQSVRIVQSAQATLARAGFHVRMVPTTVQDEYGKYLAVPATAKQGAWDLAWTGWIPDWFGDNGRTTVQPLYTEPGPGTSDYGGYDNRAVNALVLGALRAKSLSAARAMWTAANRKITNDAVVLVAAAQKWPSFHSSRVHGCVWWWLTENCDPTNVWLSG